MFLVDLMEKENQIHKDIIENNKKIMKVILETENMEVVMKATKDYVKNTLKEIKEINDIYEIILNKLEGKN